MKQLNSRLITIEDTSLPVTLFVFEIDSLDIKQYLQ